MKRFAQVFLALAGLSLVVGFGLALTGSWGGVIGFVVGGGGALLFGAISLLFHLLSKVTPKKTNGPLQFGIGMLILGALTWVYNDWITYGGEGTFFFPLFTIYLPALILGAIFTVVGLVRRKS